MTFCSFSVAFKVNSLLFKSLIDNLAEEDWPNEKKVVLTVREGQLAIGVDRVDGIYFNLLEEQTATRIEIESSIINLENSPCRTVEQEDMFHVGDSLFSMNASDEYIFNFEYEKKFCYKYLKSIAKASVLSDYAYFFLGNCPFLYIKYIIGPIGTLSFVLKENEIIEMEF